MPARPNPPLQFDGTIVSRLACPACYHDLRAETSRLICAACGRAYPIVDGIPVLIVEKAAP